MLRIICNSLIKIRSVSDPYYLNCILLLSTSPKKLAALLGMLAKGSTFQNEGITECKMSLYLQCSMKVK